MASYEKRVPYFSLQLTASEQDSSCIKMKKGLIFSWKTICLSAMCLVLWVLTETFHFGDLLCQKRCLVLGFTFNWMCQHMPRYRTKYYNIYCNTILCCSTHEIDVSKNCTEGMENANKYCDPFTFSFKWIDWNAQILKIYASVYSPFWSFNISCSLWEGVYYLYKVMVIQQCLFLKSNKTSSREKKKFITLVYYQGKPT